MTHATPTVKHHRRLKFKSGCSANALNRPTLGMEATQAPAVMAAGTTNVTVEEDAATDPGAVSAVPSEDREKDTDTEDASVGGMRLTTTVTLAPLPSVHREGVTLLTAGTPAAVTVNSKDTVTVPAAT